MENKNYLSANDVFSDVFNSFKFNFDVYIALALLGLWEFANQEIIQHFFKQKTAITLLLTLCETLIIVFFQFNAFRVLLKRKIGIETSIKDFINTNTFFSYLVCNIYFIFLATLSLLFFIIPVFYVMLTYSFAPLILLDKNIKMMDAFGRSGEITKSHKLNIIKTWVIAVVAFLPITVPAYFLTKFDLVSSTISVSNVFVGPIIFAITFSIYIRLRNMHESNTQKAVSV